jgi:hypothetical protein
MIYSLELHYYDETDKILSLPEQFIEYIQNHWREKGFVELEIEN